MNTQNFVDAKNIRFILVYLTKIIYCYSIVLFSDYKFGDWTFEEVYVKISKQIYCTTK